jgi:hypothetical protein
MVVAVWRDGVIEALSFTPSAADAGYFGPTAVHDDGPVIDVEDHDGPFWTAIQNVFSSDPRPIPIDPHFGSPCITWVE